MSERAILRAADLHAHIGDGWQSILMQLGIGEDFLRGKKKPGPCPACGGTDRYFFDNQQGRGDFHCRGCGPGDGFALLMRVHHWSFSDARKRVIGVAGLADSDTAPKARGNKLPPEKVTGRDSVAAYRPWRDLAEHLWSQSLPLRGSLAESYLLRRGCRLPPDDGDLRFLASRGEYPAAMLARVTDTGTAEPLSLHFTHLSPKGEKIADRPKHLLAGHRKRGGVVRLWPDEAVTHGLAIAEGIETALAAAHAYTPTWSTIDAGNLGGFPLLEGIESLLIVADHDEAGIRAARECARRWSAAGRKVRIALPPAAGTDAADMGAAA